MGLLTILTNHISDFCQKVTKHVLYSCTAVPTGA